MTTTPLNRRPAFTDIRHRALCTATRTGKTCRRLAIFLIERELARCSECARASSLLQHSHILSLRGFYLEEYLNGTGTLLSYYEEVTQNHCRQCRKDDLPLDQHTHLCVRCTIDNEGKGAS